MVNDFTSLIQVLMLSKRICEIFVQFWRIALSNRHIHELVRPSNYFILLCWFCRLLCWLNL